MDLVKSLREQSIDEKLLEKALAYRNGKISGNDCQLEYIYYGKENWEMAIAALLCGQNILLSGPKATGKNVFAANLACLFNRPLFETSFHVNTDSSSLIGQNTLRKGNVVFEDAVMTKGAKAGGFLVLDEINMARNDAMAVLFSMLDFRKVIDVVGYSTIKMNSETRVIATMNYGYEGTTELNEALVSRFVIIEMGMMTKDIFSKVVKDKFPNISDYGMKIFSDFYEDLQKKAYANQISSKAVDFRGIIDTLKLIKTGLKPYLAVTIAIINKVFEDYERVLIGDLAKLHFKLDLEPGDIFGEEIIK